ncbi:hypothetical protein F4813DRAFT_396391 [Daldinia decipiens]|uniref:uncharacterized protein n=1 Tax=Daldinia decipiens TaxID=326647 RepID=UPI0020C392E9|nr:uncharacterized protein F4813DRAFT_396391 [Daldinia decipiens]KAI1657489.1 hypothetical protein F4813DRAFT_396391 [Daldinia decipiens]
MSSISGHFDTGAVLLITFGVVTLFIAFIVTLLRYYLQSFDQRPLAFLDSLCVGMAWILSLVGIICAITENTGIQLNNPPEIDQFTQSLFAVSAILGKLSVCFSAWPLVKNAARVRVSVVIQVAMLLSVYPLWVIVMLETCGASPWSPMLAAYSQCSDNTARALFEWARSFFEIFTPIILTGFPLAMALDDNTKGAMRKPFYGLAVASATTGGFMWARAWMSQWFRYDHHYVPLISITIVSMIEANLGIVAANILPIATHRSKLLPPVESTKPHHRRLPVLDDSYEWIALADIPRAHTHGV